MAEIRVFEKLLRHLSHRYPSVPGWPLPAPQQKPQSPMSNSSWNIGEVIALSLGVVLIFALCFGFRIWWGRRREKRRKQQEREGVDVEAPRGDTSHDAGSEGRYDCPTVVELVPVNSNDGGQSHDQKGGDSGGQQESGHAEGHARGGHGELGHGSGDGGGNGGGGGGNGGADGTS
ncbi:hypothetical protein B0T13DRAFT_447209 [Neurospora crassa]|nr:hypothetical protein B0T13DRAFT_447209 [Neurospora crassa]